MNLLPTDVAQEISPLTNVPAYFQEALINAGAAKVFSSYQKKNDGQRLPFAVVVLDDSVEAFLKSDKSAGSVVKVVYDTNYKQHVIVAQDQASMELAQHLWTISLINSK